MNMKKSLIAAAVASVCAAPMAAQAEPELWGEFVAGFQQNNEDANGGGDADSSLNIVLDSANFGIETSEDLGNGLSAEAGTELAIGEDGDTVTTDNTYGALSGDFGSVLLGWGVDSAFYLHVLEPTDVGEVLGGYLGFAASGANDASSNTVQYGYDGGAFQLTAEAVMDDSGDFAGDATNDPENETIDRMGLGVSFDAGPVMVGVGHETQNNAEDGAEEPSMTGFSVGGGFGGFDLGLSYVMFDNDDDTDQDPTSIDLAASTDLGGGMGALAGVGIYDADTDDDAGNVTGFHVQLSQELSSRTMVFGQLQSQSIDGGDAADDTDPRTVFVGISHAF